MESWQVILASWAGRKAKLPSMLQALQKNLFAAFLGSFSLSGILLTAPLLGRWRLSGDQGKGRLAVLCNDTPKRQQQNKYSYVPFLIIQKEKKVKHATQGNLIKKNIRALLDQAGQGGSVLSSSSHSGQTDALRKRLKSGCRRSSESNGPFMLGKRGLCSSGSQAGERLQLGEVVHVSDRAAEGKTPHSLRLACSVQGSWLSLNLVLANACDSGCQPCPLVALWT